jgi:hypothetical protein
VIIKQASLVGKFKGLGGFLKSSSLMQVATVALIASSGLALHQQSQLASAKDQIRKAQAQISELIEVRGLEITPENPISAELLKDGSITPDKLDGEFLQRIETALNSLENIPESNAGTGFSLNSLNGLSLSNEEDYRSNSTYTPKPNQGNINSPENLKRLKISDSSGSLSSDGALLYLNYTGSAPGGEIFRVNDEASDPTPFVIDRFGNVGIGTSTPGAALQIRAGTSSNAPLKFSPGTLLSTPQDGSFEFDGLGLYFTLGGERFLLTSRTLRQSVSLDFPSTSAGYSDLTVVAPGAQVGDVVNIVSPYDPLVGGVYAGWVTSTDTVVIRYETNGSYNPAAGTYTIVVSKQ